MRRTNYERDDKTFSADAYKIGRDGVAWRVLGWEVAPIETWFCQDCGRAGYEQPEGGGAVTEQGDADCAHEIVSTEADSERTGQVVAIMVGDDRRFTFDSDELTPIAEDAYCSSCGKIGCPH